MYSSLKYTQKFMIISLYLNMITSARINNQYNHLFNVHACYFEQYSVTQRLFKIRLSLKKNMLNRKYKNIYELAETEDLSVCRSQ